MLVQQAFSCLVKRSREQRAFRFSVRFLGNGRHRQDGDSASDSDDWDNQVDKDSNDEFPGHIGYFHPPKYTIKDKHLSDHVSNALLRGGDSEDREKGRNLGMWVQFLGTGAGQSSWSRNSSSTIVRASSSDIIIDVGDGTYRQTIFSTSQCSKIERILITHMHGDHIFGLVSLLLSIKAARFNAKEKPEKGYKKVKVYGPVGLFNFIAFNILFTRSDLIDFNIEVYELVDAKTQPTKRGHQPYHPWKYAYPEFKDYHEKQRLVRKFIYPKDGVWTIADFEPPTREEIERGKLKENDPRLRIRAAEVQHSHYMTTFGYTIEEDQPPRSIDPQRAIDLDVAPGPKFDLLKRGFPVMTEKGDREVSPDEVLLKSQKKKARKVTVVGDNKGWSDEMIDIAEKSDVLVHEATLMAGREKDAIERSHSTSTMAGEIAARINASVLVLNHISPKVHGKSLEQDLLEEAEAPSGGKVKALVAYDFMQLSLPLLGFSSPEHTDEETRE